MTRVDPRPSHKIVTQGTRDSSNHVRVVGGPALDLIGDPGLMVQQAVDSVNHTRHFSARSRTCRFQPRPAVNVDYVRPNPAKPCGQDSWPENRPDARHSDERDANSVAPE